MFFLGLLWWLPAAVGLTELLRHLLPWELPDNLVPLLVVLSCVAAVFIPVYIDVALGMSVLVGLFYSKYLKTRINGVDPLVLPTLVSPSWLRSEPHTEYIYQAEHVSGDLDEMIKAPDQDVERLDDDSLPRDAETGQEVEPPARPSYVPAL